jgi:TolB-like protein
MASIIPGYEYDIFISYRQNDNRSGWVTEFVAAFEEELAATLKEHVSLYFDTNLKDGLLETHNVDKSLETKLKCLIFMPVISQTYCDVNSFAWKNEFLAFNKIARNDKFGIDIRVSGGNVASRILPVKIHDLDAEDKTLLENELGGVLRSVDFIYREAGVNRPLRPVDIASENLNRTQYRNQVNKLAYAVKEIITGIGNFSAVKAESLPDKVMEIPVIKSVKAKRFKLKTVLIPVIIAALLISAIILVPALAKSTEQSIAVLPLENMSNDPSKEYIGDGMMQEILNHLFMIGGLKIPSGTSSMRFKGSKLSIRKIAGQLDVSYLLEGNVSLSGNNIRIIVRLINGKNGKILWTTDSTRTLTAINLFDIQSEVAQKVAESLKLVLNPDVEKRIKARPTENTEAYLLFLQARQKMGQNDSVRQLLERAIVLDPEFSDAYAALALYWLIQGNDLYGKLNHDQVLEKTEPLLKKALELDQNSVMAHTYLASVRLWYNWDFKSVEKEFRIVNQLNPSTSDSYLEFVQYLIIIGKFDDALMIINKTASENNINGDRYVALAMAYCYSGQQEKALQTVETYLNDTQIDKFILFNAMRIYISTGKYDKVIELYEKHLANKPVDELSDCFLGYLGVAFYKTGNKTRADEFLKTVSSRSMITPVGSPSYFTASIYMAMDEKDKALQELRKAFTNHEVEMTWLKVDPIFQPLKNDTGFENLLREIGFV